MQELSHKVSRLRSDATQAEREATAAQQTADKTGKRMNTALELASALRGEAARWAESADSIQACPPLAAPCLLCAGAASGLAHAVPWWAACCVPVSWALVEQSAPAVGAGCCKLPAAYGG